MTERQWGWNTRLVHGGEPRPRVGGAISMPIYQSSTFEQRSEDTTYESLQYIRLNNLPNQLVAGKKLAALEGAESGLVASSGMAAITTTVLSVLKAGDHLLAQDVLYGGTRTFLAHDLPAFGIDVDFVASDEISEWERARRPNTRAIYVESLTNPLLHMSCLEEIASFARERNLVSMIDNTVPTPIFFRPLEHGFDLSIHSATKFLNGHADIVAGAVVGSQERVHAILQKLNHLGGSLDPHAAFLLLRGMRTLKLRMEHQSRTALELAQFLESHEAVSAVHHPGLASHPSHQRAARLLEGYGALFSFRVRGGAEAAERVLDRVELAANAPSFGGTETLLTCPATSSHVGMSAEERAASGIDGDLLRMAVGVEDFDDLRADLTLGLEAT